MYGFEDLITAGGDPEKGCNSDPDYSSTGLGWWNCQELEVKHNLQACGAEGKWWRSEDGVPGIMVETPLHSTLNPLLVEVVSGSGEAPFRYEVLDRTTWELVVPLYADGDRLDLTAVNVFDEGGRQIFTADRAPDGSFFAP